MAYDVLSGGSGNAQTSTLTITSAAWRGVMWAFKAAAAASLAPLPLVIGQAGKRASYY
jgi:hypothetical protein